MGDTKGFDMKEPHPLRTFDAADALATASNAWEMPAQRVDGVIGRDGLVTLWRPTQYRSGAWRAQRVLVAPDGPARALLAGRMVARGLPRPCDFEAENPSSGPNGVARTINHAAGPRLCVSLMDAFESELECLAACVRIAIGRAEMARADALRAAQASIRCAAQLAVACERERVEKVRLGLIAELDGARR